MQKKYCVFASALTKSGRALHWHFSSSPSNLCQNCTKTTFLKDCKLVTLYIATLGSVKINYVGYKKIANFLFISYIRNKD